MQCCWSSGQDSETWAFSSPCPGGKGGRTRDTRASGTQQQVERLHPAPAAKRTTAAGHSSKLTFLSCNFNDYWIIRVRGTACEQTAGDKALNRTNRGRSRPEGAGGAPGQAGFRPALCTKAQTSKQQVWQVPLNLFSYTHVREETATFISWKGERDWKPLPGAKLQVKKG